MQDKYRMSKYREKLENEKLESEIRELNKPWLKKTKNLNTILTFIITIFTFLSAGFLAYLSDIKSERLKLEREELKRDIFNFTQQRDSLIQSIEQLQDSLLFETRKRARLYLDFSKQSKEVENLRLEKLNKDEVIAFYRNKLDSIQNILNKDIGFLTDQDGSPILTQSGKKIQIIK